MDIIHYNILCTDRESIRVMESSLLRDEPKKNRRQDLIEKYAAGEQPRPNAQDCHRAMRGVLGISWAGAPAETGDALDVLGGTRMLERVRSSFGTR